MHQGFRRGVSESCRDQCELRRLYLARDAALHRNQRQVLLHDPLGKRKRTRRTSGRRRSASSFATRSASTGPIRRRPSTLKLSPGPVFSHLFVTDHSSPFERAIGFYDIGWRRSTMNDRGIWATWYDLPEKGRERHLQWLHGTYIPKIP